MKPIYLIPLATRGNGDSPRLATLEQLAVSLSYEFRTPCQIQPERVDISFAKDARRGQFYSTVIVQKLESLTNPGARILGVTTADLFVPVLTFVFGEAQLQGSCAVVSSARLGEEFYGLPAQESLLQERLLKEAVHELGHTFGLVHCNNWTCVMTSSHSVERLDTKTAHFCPACSKVVTAI